MSLKIISKVFVFLYLLHFTIPYFGVSDKIHVQTFYLSCLNIISLLYLLVNKENRKLVIHQIVKLPIIIFLLFCIWSMATAFHAVNSQEALIQINFYFVQLVSLISILTYIYRLKNQLKSFVQVVIVTLCFAELIPSLYQYINDISEFGAPVFRNLAYRGFTGNVNILAFSLLIKIPFLYHFIITKRYKIFYTLLTILSIFVIIHMTKTRGAILGLSIITTIYFTYYIFLLVNRKKFKIQDKIKFRLLYLVIPTIFVFITDFQLEKNIFSSDKDTFSRLSSLNTTDYSTQSRFRYFSQAIETIIEYPLFGIGTGNWEIYSIFKDSKNMNGYIVPYHVHNDFLEIAAENGLIGFILYFSLVFYIIFLLCRKLFVQINLNKIKDNYLFPLIISFIVFLMDSLINFPAARPLSVTNLIFVISISIVVLNKEVKTVDFKYSKNLLILILCLTPISIYSSSKLFLSSKQQTTLIRYFNSSGRMEIDKEFIDNVSTDYPSVTSTTIPVKTIQGVYYFNQKNYDKAIELLKEGYTYNPYLPVTDIFIGKSYYEKKENDSALFYIDKAYKALPKNDLHVSEYFKILTRLKDSVKLKTIYSNLSEKKEIYDELYLAAMTTINEGDQSSYAFDGIEFYPESGNERIIRGYYALKLGYQDMIAAASAHVIAEEYFSNKQFNNALELFKTAVELNPLEIPYQENLANTFLQLDLNNDAIDIINQIESQGNQLTNKAIYIRALAYLGTNNFDSGCYDLKLLLNNRMIDQVFYNNFCSN